MRMTKLLIVICCITMMLCGCRRTVDSPADEIVLYEWRSELDNGNTVSLSFSDDRAAVTAVNDSFKLSVSGYCAVYDDRFIISDTRTKDNYTFYYRLYGDRVELTYDGGTISVDKAKERV